MPNFNTNDPAALGWSLGTGRVRPFSYRGHAFPQGLDERLVAVFTIALDRICAQPNFQLHSGSGLGDGMWGYENRNVKAGNTKSFHAYANALDLNAPWNPFAVISPPMGPYRLPLNTSELVEPLGLLWGGGPRWGNRRDWMHLENHNSPAEAAGYQAGGQPAPTPPAAGLVYPLPAGDYYGPFSGPAASISGQGVSDGQYRRGLRVAQSRLGVTADGLYGPNTASATVRFQEAHGLVADGLIGPATWAALVRG